ncbi:MAG TPA: PIN domain-containing protein [Thermoanaerobaculia bacterium]|jgi:predicted nucleic acid-binding protein|nr:PIN domain-containing protein [Thermoanaerobaculia bacterium]
MAKAALYLDSSALVKLVVREAESEALFDFLSAYPRRISSILATTEVPRAVRRLPEVPDNLLSRASQVLDNIEQIELSPTLAVAAAALEPATLRSLDALHLASALALGDELAGIVSYDRRLTDAAREVGLSVYTPGALQTM